MPPRVLASDSNPAGAKTIIRFGFCDIQNNQGLGKGYQAEPKATPNMLSHSSHTVDIVSTFGKSSYLLT